MVHIAAYSPSAAMSSGVGAVLDDVAVVEDDDGVGVLRAARAVGYEGDGSVGGTFADAVVGGLCQGTVGVPRSRTVDLPTGGR